MIITHPLHEINNSPFGLWRARTTGVGPMPTGIRLPSEAGYISIIPPFGGRNAFRNGVMKHPHLNHAGDFAIRRK